jgi:hypothetical protein
MSKTDIYVAHWGALTCSLAADSTLATVAFLIMSAVAAFKWATAPEETK